MCPTLAATTGEKSWTAASGCAASASGSASGFQLTFQITAKSELNTIFLIAAGTNTSHIAILARSLGIPAVVGLRDATARLTGDERVVLDGMPGAFIHDGCRLKFGPDGMLYATMGDAAVTRTAQE
mgnify:CR=1 FL=1